MTDAEAQIEPLKTFFNASGYRSVYVWRQRLGETLYCAKVKRRGVLRTLPGSYSSDPTVPALHVARWYLSEYGPNWPRLVKTNRRKAGALIVWRSHELDGYLARVWIRGRPVDVLSVTDLVTPVVFKSRPAALEGAREWVRSQYGTLDPMYR